MDDVKGFFLFFLKFLGAISWIEEENLEGGWGSAGENLKGMRGRKDK